MQSIPALALGEPLSAGRLLHQRQLPTTSTGPPPSLSAYPPSELLANLRDVFATDDSRQRSQPRLNGSSPLSSSYVGPDESVRSVIEGRDELTWSATRIVWTRGVQVVRTFSFGGRGHVRQAFFAWFDLAASDQQAGQSSKGQEERAPSDASRSHPLPPSISSAHRTNSRQNTTTFSSASSIASSSYSSSVSQDQPSQARALCFVHGDGLEIHLASGDRHLVHLPFPFKQAWPLDLGILMQASSVQSDEMDALGYPTEQPALYSLADRFGEPRPVVVQPSSSPTNGSRAQSTEEARPFSVDTDILLVAGRYSPVPLVVARTPSTGDVLVLYCRERDPTAPLTAPGPAKLSPPTISHPTLPSATRLRGRASLSQVGRRNSSLGPSDSFANPSSGTAARAARTPVSGGTRSAPEQDPMFSKMVRGPIPTSLDPISVQDRRLSLGRTDLNKSMDRMVLDGELDELRGIRPPIGVTDVEEEVGGLELVMLYTVPRAASSGTSLVEASLSTVSPCAASLSLLDRASRRLSTFDVISSPSPDVSSPISVITVTPAGSRSARSAVPSHSTRDPGQLVLDGSGSLVQGSNETAPSMTFRIPRNRRAGSFIRQSTVPTLRIDLASSASTPPAGHSTASPEALSAAPCGATCLAFSDGSSMAIKLPRGSNGLVERCLDALDYVLDPQDAAYLQNRLSRTGGGRVSEWQPFVEQLLTLVGLRREDTSTITSPAQVRPWERLQSSSVHDHDSALVALASSDSCSRRLPPSSDVSPDLDAPRLAKVARALHLLAEDCKLSLARLIDLDRLGPLLGRLSAALGREDWVDYWFRSVPSESGEDWYRPRLSQSDLLPPPPDIYGHLSSTLHRRSGLRPWTSLADLSGPRPLGSASRKGPCTLTDSLLAVYAELGKASSSTDPSAQAALAVRCIVDHGITLDNLLQMPFGVSLPLHEVIRACQASPPSDWPAAAYELVQRPDMASRVGVNIAAKARRLEFSLESRAIASLTAAASSRRVPVPHTPSASMIESASSREQTLRFGSDRRVEEVDRMLSTTRTVTISLPTRLNLTDQEMSVAQKTAALALTQRTAAISVGQGVFAFGTCSATLTRSWPIPPIDLSVRVLPQGIVPTIDAAALGEEAREWSNFHNGVAAGLRISPEAPPVDSSWVVFNRPAEQGSTHAGFLLGLGLTGHLRGMMPWHAFPYLDSRHNFTSIGLLLGLASSYAGTQDVLLTKILSLHVHALLPYGSRELNASPLTQAAALLGIGILYTGSRNRKMAEVALAEISRSTTAPPDPLSDYREAYAFSAAMSFGMVMVGRGGADRSPRDLEMVAQLRLAIFGSSPAALNAKEAVVDVNITGPGATAALGLMYLRSDRQDMADILHLPSSRFDLDLVRPDILLVRTLARSLILWSSISPSLDWVESNVPSFIRSALRKRKRDGVKLDHGVEAAYFNIMAGACFAVGLKYAGTARSTVHSLLLHYYDLFWKAANVAPTSFEHRLRLSTARACLNVVAISLAVVMAGTGELSVLSRLRLAHGQSDKGVSFGSHMAIHMALGILFLGGGRYTLGSSDAAIAAMVCAFFPRFHHAQGDNLSYPQAYRHLWALAVEPRCFVAQDVDSGESVYLPIKVKLEEDGAVGSHHLISPTLLPPVERLVTVKIDSPRYWPVHLDPVGSVQDRMTLTQNDPVSVKRRAGFLSYAADPKGNRSIFVQAGLIGAAPDLGAMAVSRGSSAVGLDAVRDLVPSLTPDPFLVAFFRRLCSGSGKSSPPPSMSAFAGAAFLECLISDQPQILRLYLQIHQLRSATTLTPSLPLLLQNVQMARRIPASTDACHLAHLRPATAPPPIIRTSLLRQVETCLSTLVDEFRNQASFRSRLGDYARSQTVGRVPGTGGAEDLNGLALYLVAGGVPPRAVLSTLRHLVEEARRQTSHLAPDAGGAAPEEGSVLERGLRIVLAATAKRVAGPDAQAWEERAVEEILACW